MLLDDWRINEFESSQWGHHDYYCSHKLSTVNEFASMKKVPNALRVSRAASLTRSAPLRAASHNRNRAATGRDSGVGLHALVGRRAICPQFEGMKPSLLSHETKLSAQSSHGSPCLTRP